MAELFEAVTSLPALLLVLLVFGFAPGFVLRLLVLVYPRSDPRRRELIAELYVVPRIQRPLWVAEQLEVALFEGIRHRRLTRNTAPDEVPAYPPVSGSRVRELERMRQEGEQLLARRMQDILVGVGLTQIDNSIDGSRTLHIPEVISVTERPVGLDIRMLPGQRPNDFAAHAKRIAYNLGIDEVRVVSLGHSLIQLILLP